jgi:hypothetical protein
MRILPFLLFATSKFSTAYNKYGQIPDCRNCIFFDPVKTTVSGVVISEGRCLKSALIKPDKMYYSPKEITQLARFDFVESCRQPGAICGPHGYLFLHKEK